MSTIRTAPLPAGENLTMVFNLKDWGAESRAFSVQDNPTTQSPPITDGSVFSSSAAVSAGSLCLAIVIYAVACCLDGIPLC